MKLSLKNEIRRCRPLLGTFVEVTVRDPDNTHAHSAINSAFAAIERVHNLMSFHDQQSEVSQLNHWAVQESVVTSVETYKVLRCAKELHARTGGVFDITVADEMMELGLLPCHGFLSGQDCLGRTCDIELLPKRQVRFMLPLYIDLGGIAKGFAVDQAVVALRNSGIECGLVNAGGDMRCFGAEEHSVWGRHPENPRQLLPLSVIKNMALATSANYYERQEERSVCAHIHGQTRQPLMRSLSVSVMANSCMIADALTKVVLLGSTELGEQCLSFYKARALVFDFSDQL